MVIFFKASLPTLESYVGCSQVQLLPPVRRSIIVAEHVAHAETGPRERLLVDL